MEEQKNVTTKIFFFFFFDDMLTKVAIFLQTFISSPRQKIKY